MSAPPRPPLSVVIPTYQGEALLRRCLPSVVADLGPDDELIVVDDGSSDGSVALVRTLAPSARPLARAGNGGFGVAATEGVMAARHPVVVLLNNDVRVEPGALSALAAPFALAPACFAVAARAEMAADRSLYQGWTFPEWERGTFRHSVAAESAARPTLWAAGGMGAFHRERMLALGGFDPIFAPFYWEDVDLCYRAWKRGWTVLYEPAARLIHDHQGTIGRLFRRRYIRTIQERNRYLFTWLNITDRSLLRAHLRGLPHHLLGTARVRLFGAAFALALLRLPAVLRRRRAETAPQRSDAEIMALLTG